MWKIIVNKERRENVRDVLNMEFENMKKKKNLKNVEKSWKITTKKKLYRHLLKERVGGLIMYGWYVYTRLHINTNKKYYHFYNFLKKNMSDNRIEPGRGYPANRQMENG